MANRDDFSERRSQLSNAKQELLKKRLRGKQIAPPTITPITRGPESTVVPMSFAQERLWFLDQLEPGNAFYNEPVALRLVGKLDLAALTRSFETIVQRREILRTTFALVDDRPAQIIASRLAFEIPVIDLRELPDAERVAEVKRLTEADAQQPFDLATGPLIHITLLQVTAEEHVLLMTMHHIITDGWSMGVLVREFAALYAAFSTGQPSPLPELTTQYADFAVWQREWLQGEVIQRHITYWERQLASAPSFVDLPTDYPRPSVQSFRGNVQPLELSPSLVDSLKALSAQEGVTLFMTLLAALNILLYRYTHQDDISIGTPSANRTQMATENLTGFFVNTLVLRTKLVGTASFLDVLRQVRSVALEAYSHQDIPFEKLVEVLRPERDLGRSPLFNIMFLMQNVPASEFELPGLVLEPIDIENRTAKFDLTLELWETADGMEGWFEYATDLFEPATIERLGMNLSTLLEEIVAIPELPIDQYTLLTAAERHRLLGEWNSTATAYPDTASIHQLFEAQVDQTPDAVAVIFEDKQFTFRELNQRANHLAHYLRALKPNNTSGELLVGVYMERSLQTMVGLLGVLKAGGAYVPLDPSYPQERLRFMLEDSQAAILLTQQRLLASLPSHTAQIVCLDSDWEQIAACEDTNLDLGVNSDNLAYVMYTSGSTGKPKGVLGLHRNTINRFAWMWQSYPFVPNEVCCQKTALSFVDSVWELFGPLLRGVPTVIIPDDAVRTPKLLLQTLAIKQVTRIVLVPSLLHLILDAYPNISKLLPRLRYWVTSGEAISPELRQRFLTQVPQGILINLYGSSEVAADVTSYEVDPAERATCVPIGHPIANTRIYLLDANLRPVPLGAPGEVYIAGHCLARGYLRQPELTAARFLPDPFSELPATRMYRTGDRARYLADGNLEFLGRVDHQVKLRGYRIELGEIESALRSHPSIRDVIVMTRAESEGEDKLIAYVVPHAEIQLGLQELRTFLKELLPEYMIPATFMLLDAVPLLPNGKVDRRSLMQLEGERLVSQTPYIAPQDDIERLIAGLWKEALQVERVGVHDNFFDLGGHSILVVQVHSKLQDALKRELSLIDLFRYPTISDLARYLGQTEEELPASEPDREAIRAEGKDRLKQLLRRSSK